MPLQLKSQGFPKVLDDLGVQQPLVGPFWGFEPTLLPTYRLGSSHVDTSAGPPLNRFFSMGLIGQPGSGAVLANTIIQNLEVGWHALHIRAAWNNADAIVSYVQLQLRDQGGVPQQTEYLWIVPATGGSNNRDSKETDLVLLLPIFGWQWLILNAVALPAAGSSMVASIRSRFLGNPFSEPLP